jgi:hypothetical protein
LPISQPRIFHDQTRFLSIFLLPRPHLTSIDWSFIRAVRHDDSAVAPSVLSPFQLRDETGYDTSITCKMLSTPPPHMLSILPLLSSPDASFLVLPHLMLIDWMFVRAVRPDDSAVVPSAPSPLRLQDETGVVAGGIHETRVAAGGWVGQGAQHGTLLVGSEATPRAPRAASRPHTCLAFSGPSVCSACLQTTRPCLRLCCAKVPRLRVRANTN